MGGIVTLIDDRTHDRMVFEHQVATGRINEQQQQQWRQRLEAEEEASDV